MTLDPQGWRLVTDGVMGGVSEGRLTRSSRDGVDCWALAGRVSTANNGGFIQAALEVPNDIAAHANEYDGLRVKLFGNGEHYNVHLRTSYLWLPWQSYRTTVSAGPSWQTIDLPFARFEPYKTGSALRPEKLKRVGIVAIGREFDAEICIGDLGFYRARDAG